MKLLISQEIEKVTDEAENLGFDRETRDEKNIYVQEKGSKDLQ